MRSKLAGVVVAVALSAFGATRAHADVVQDWKYQWLKQHGTVVGPVAATTPSSMLNPVAGQ